jgi:hypothetical protein
MPSQLYSFEMRGKPWSAVFEWLTDKTGRGFSSTNNPSGTRNVITPKGKKYTIPQIIDLVNDGLLSQKWVLLNRGTTFSLVPADEKIDPALVPRIALKELSEHGDTEIVSTVYQCQALVAEDSAPEVKRQLGPFGEVITLHKANQLILQDTVGNLKRITKALDDQEAKPVVGREPETYSHKCIYIRARDAEAIVRNVLGETKTEERPKGAGFPGKGSKGGRPGKNQSTTTTTRTRTITSNDRTNTVFVNGPSEVIAQAKAIMAKIDVGTIPFSSSAWVLKTYAIKEGTLVDLSKTLALIHKGIRLSPIDKKRVTVLASAEDHTLIERIISLDDASTSTLVEALRRMLQQEKEKGGN